MHLFKRAGINLLSLSMYQYADKASKQIFVKLMVELILRPFLVITLVEHLPVVMFA